ncbi:hypothetical protein EHP00_247 [Ecytonucleospora hepatopenaei]|uniref:Uncharacterized protein n=1 Tax=Ecytonucleospora hepatopenaei TaxID=646526 RepID=A0A1W0E6M4_9MICR|nr:hypothetical protein EHP00_247 [Ecytonucleospora hepatopenaei]
MTYDSNDDKRYNLNSYDDDSYTYNTTHKYNSTNKSNKSENYSDEYDKFYNDNKNYNNEYDNKNYSYEYDNKNYNNEYGYDKYNTNIYYSEPKNIIDDFYKQRMGFPCDNYFEGEQRCFQGKRN